MLPQGFKLFVHREGVLFDGFDFFLRGELQRQSMVFVDQGIAQIVVFIGELNGRSVEGNAFLHAVALGEGTGGNVPDNDFQRHDGNFLNEGFTLAELLHEMGGDAFLLEPLHQQIAHPVVDNALALNGTLFQAVESGGVVLVVDNQQCGVIRAEYLFGLSFIKLFTLDHASALLRVFYGRIILHAGGKSRDGRTKEKEKNNMAETGFGYRGFMLDSSRHYMPAEEIRQLLRAAAVLGLNRMHWHLTDDQGWRIEIRKYPLLAGKGSVRGDSFFGGTPAGERNCGYYTQAEIRDLIRYAGSLGVEIVPEIEIPGHAAAMLAAYPRFGCRKSETERWRDRVEISGGIFPSLICAGSDGAVSFLKDILDEVAELFPYELIHIGGDEAVKYRWRRCPDCQRRMKEKQLGSEDALQRWLVLEIGAYLAAKGKRTVVWNDVLEGGQLPGHFIVQQWMGGEEKTRAFMESGGQVIRSETKYCYMDYPYGAIDVSRIWEMPRIPEWAEGMEDRLLGMECPLWTERVTNLERVAYLLFPRLTAMSLRMAGEAEGIGRDEFMARVSALEKEREKQTGLRGAPPEKWHLSPEEAEAEREAENRKIHAPEALPYVRKQDELLKTEREEKARKYPQKT